MTIHVRRGMAAVVIVFSTTLLATASGASFRASAALSSATTTQFGMNTFVPYNCESNSSWSQLATTQFQAFKGLGANAVALAFPLYTDSLTSNAFYAKNVCNTQYQSPTPTELATLVHIAHAMGLQVFVRPLLYETNLQAEKPGAWRGIIDPTNTDLWFRNYWTTMLPYLQMAQSNHVEHFAISTELQSMAAKPNWKALIAKARHVYSGDLVYTANWAPGENDEIHWGGTSVGLDLYSGVQGLSSTATPAQVVAGWNHELTTKNPFPLISSATISETGILPQDGAYSQPYSWSLPLAQYPFNQSIQANWFTAVCRFFTSHKMGGVYFWGSAIYEQNGALLRTPSMSASTISEIQPLAQQAIKVCFTGK
ncbi:MAG: hypothetical protein ABSB55_02900 [Acidimicrobiales bacterium]